MLLASCPSVLELERLFIGGLPAAEIDALEQHVAVCSQCLENLKSRLPARDLLSEVLADPTATPTPDLSPEVGRLMTRLLALRPAPVTAGPLSDAPTLLPSLSAGLEVTSGVLSGTESGHEENAPTSDTYLTDFLSSAQSPEELGRLGKYRILKILGHGGMGVVYLAEDLQLKRRVALKAMLPTLAASASAGQRFLREAQSMATVKHDHIVTIYQVDEERGVPFLAMELLPGEPLDERLQREPPLGLAEVVRIGREVAEGLAAAHEQGLIHRDIKPGNIWLEAPRARVKILDFGLARAAEQNAQLTQQGAIVGTPAFMAPEQARGEAVDARCDLFSLGVVLYRLCTGEQPFVGTDTISTLMSVVTDEPPAPVLVNSAVPPELSDLVMRLLEKNPATRLASANEVVRILQALEKKLARQQVAEDRTEVVSGLDLPRPGGRRAPTPKAAPRRSRVPLLVAAAVLLVGLTGFGLWAAGVFRFQTPPGDLVLETDDPDFRFSVLPGGGITLEDRKTNHIYNVKAVRLDKDKDVYELDVTDAGAELNFKTKTFTIKRGDKVAVKMWFERTAGVVAAGPIPESWYKEVAALPPEKQVTAVAAKLKERNPRFDSKVTHKIDKDRVTELYVPTDDVTDLSPVRALSELKRLVVSGTGASALPLDLSPLKDMKLTRLDCRHTQVSDLSPLKGMPLNYLDCGATKVADLSPLKGMGLTYLDCTNTRVSDLSPLQGMTLTFLNCRNTKVADLSPLKGMPLKSLSCDFQPERDANILQSLKTLEAINGKPAGAFLTAIPIPESWFAEVTALTPDKQVAAVTAKLKERNPHFVGIVSPTVTHGVVVGLEFSTDAVTDLAPVRALVGLQHLVCSGGRYRKGSLADLSPLKGMKLTKLWCDNTAVLDLSPLEDMKLTYLNCGYTGVSDLSPLKGMPLTQLDCDHTQVADLSPLKGMPLNYLECGATKVSDLSPLKGLPLTTLSCGMTGVSDLSPLKGMPLTDLRFGAAGGVSDLSPLKDMKLTILGCLRTGVSDLSPLKGMPLTQLDCRDTKVADLSPLQGMPLTSLACRNTKVSDLSPLKGMPLTGLWCDGTKVSDLSPLKGMPLKNLFWDFKPERDADILHSLPLETINEKPAAVFWKDVAAPAKPAVDDVWEKGVAVLLAEKQVAAVVARLKERNPGFDGKVTHKIEGGVVVDLMFLSDKVTDISPIRALAGLRLLSCTGTHPGAGQLADLSPLKGMKLTRLFCYSNPHLVDLSPLKDMPLTFLDCHATPVTDLSPLKGMKLNTLDCSLTPVSDLSPLKGMPLGDLRFDKTPVSDLSPLKGMKLETLSCADTKVADLSPLKDMVVAHLRCPFKADRDAELLRSLKTLKTINSKPAAEFLKDVADKKP